ncbi:MAG: MFS transporter, partial [Candidatus Zixiibacteriota bacterium]
MNISSLPDKRAVAGWAMYDFANTIFSMNIVTMYFAQWVVVDNKTEDIYYSISYAVSMLLVAFTMPALGAVSDVKGKRLPFLFVLTSGCILSTFVLGIAGNNLDNAATKVLVALILFAIANFCYEGALTFYNALLPEVSTPPTIVKVYGWGVALGYVGAIAGLFLIKPFVDSHIFGFKIPFTGGGRQDAFIPTAVFFLLFSIPIFLWVKENAKTSVS